MPQELTEQFCSQEMVRAHTLLPQQLAGDGDGRRGQVDLVGGVKGGGD